MTAKVEQKSNVEPHAVKMSLTTTASATSVVGPRLSMFAAKSGFVIPKNKLSGSMVPIFRGGKKLGISDDAADEASTKEYQRKTKWGPDLSQDAAVRKGRALAYQARVDQIAQQLKSGTMELEDYQSSPLAGQDQDDKFSNDQIDNEKAELLALEKREAIGEILKLNPSYKAPADYKPLVKETKVPIPVKDYPGYNFVALIYGSGSETKKRLEKETGAKIQVCGTRAHTGEKVEISPSNANEIQGAFEELHVNISANTYEKADAAVALIELLLTSISGNLTAVSTSTTVSTDNTNAFSQSQDAATSYVVPPPGHQNQGMVQPPVVPRQTLPQNQFQYPGSWLQTAPQNPMHFSSGFAPPLNPSAPIHSNSSNVPSSSFNSSMMPSTFGPRPNAEVGFNQIPHNPSLISPRPHLTQTLQHQYMTQTHAMGPSASNSHNVSAAFPFTNNQNLLRGPSPNSRPLSQPPPNAPPGSLLDQPSTPTGRHTAWSGAAQVSMLQARPLLPLAPTSNLSTTNVVTPYPAAATLFTSVPPGQMGSFSAQSATNSSMHHGRGFAPIASPVQSMQLTPLQPGNPGLSGSIPNFAPIRPPPMMTVKPHRPNSGDFTFQPHQLLSPASQPVGRPNTLPSAQNTLPLGLMNQRPAPQTPSFHLPVPGPIQEHVPQGFTGPSLVSNQMGQSQAQRSAFPFAPNHVRHPSFFNATPGVPTNLVPQMGPRNLSQPSQNPSMVGPLPPRPGNSVQLEQHHPAHITRRGFPAPPDQQFGSSLSTSGKLTSNPGGQQIYDPFLPTSAPIVPQQPQGNQGKAKKQENDTEYEDLMASVGVK